MRQETDRRRRVRIWQRCALQVDELAAVLVLVAGELEPLAAAFRVGDRDSRPRGNVAPRRRAEGPEIGSDEVRQALRPPRHRADRPSPPRGPGGRPAVAPMCPTVGRGRDRPRGRGCRRTRLPARRAPSPSAARPRRATSHLSCCLLQGSFVARRPGSPERPSASSPPDTQREAPELASRDDMNRGPHQRRLDDAPVLEGLGERVPLGSPRAVSTAPRIRMARTASGGPQPARPPPGSTSSPAREGADDAAAPG